MSAVATLLVTWAAIYAYVGAYNIMLHARRPASVEYLAFGLMSFALGVWTLGWALGIDAATRPDARFAMTLSYLGGHAATAFFLDFATRLVGRWRPAVTLAGYAVCGLAILGDVAGWTVSAEEAVPATRWLGQSSRVFVTLTPFGYLVAGLVAAVATYGVVVLTLGTRERRQLRFFVATAILAVIAGLHDIVVPALGIATVRLLDHVGLLPILAMSELLLRRFVANSHALAERTDELRRSYGELRTTQEELVRAEQLAAVGELSAVIAHEVRNPLAVIKNATSSLRRPTLRAQDRGVLLDILDEEVDRLGRLVRDLLAYARPVPPEARPVLIAELVDLAVAIATANAERSAPVEVRLDVDPLAEVEGDRELLAQALRNVVDNALSAMPDGGRLEVRAHALDARRRVVIEVSDTGEGMDPATREKATAPFFTTRPKGTGLGLAIVERVVRNHGGSLEIESTAGEGTLVRMVLPRVRPSALPEPARLPEAGR